MFLTSKISLKTPLAAFVKFIYENFIPSEYGKLLYNKILHDLDGYVQRTPPGADRGDININFKFFFDFKMSTLNKGGQFRFNYIRKYQEFDYFILCFIKPSDKKYQIKFYVLKKESITNNKEVKLDYTNGTKHSNVKNTNPSFSWNVSEDDVDFILDKHNLLPKNNLPSLIGFIKNKHEEAMKMTENNNITPKKSAITNKK